jgi:hypothetical protein
MHSQIQVDQDDRVLSPGPWDGSPIVIRKLKLIFFTIPKNSCEEFKKLFRRMEGFEDWRTSWNMPPSLYFPDQPPTTLPHDPMRNGLTYLYNLTLDEASTIINDKSWTKAIFVRDPLVRFLSAYIDKIICHNSRHPHAEGVSFPDFVTLVESGFQDVHWNPQCHLIDCPKWLPAMDFIGSFEEVAKDTEILLKKTGAWEEFGSNGWGNGSHAIFQGTKNAAHASNTDRLAYDYYDDNLIQRTRELLAADLEFITTIITE